MAKTKKSPSPTLDASVAVAASKTAETLAAIEGMPLLRRPQHPTKWGEEDLDIQAAHTACEVARAAISEAQSSIYLIGRLIREEQERRWRDAPTVSAAELEKRIAEQQAESEVFEAFCRHCGKGYMMMPGNEVAEDGTVIKDSGHCRCGGTDFLYRASSKRQHPVTVRTLAEAAPPAVPREAAPNRDQLSIF